MNQQSSRTTARNSPGSGRESEQGKLLVNLLAENHSRANKSGKHRITLEGYGYR
jgi:maltose alpha-D-glucosyltransferase/alpha-amylase